MRKVQVTKSQVTSVTETGNLHRTQVLLEEWQFQRLQKQARNAGTSVAALIRNLVEKSLEAPTDKHSLDRIKGLGSSGKSGRDHDEELYG